MGRQSYLRTEQVHLRRPSSFTFFFSGKNLRVVEVLIKKTKRREGVKTTEKTPCPSSLPPHAPPHNPAHRSTPPHPPQPEVPLAVADSWPGTLRDWRDHASCRHRSPSKASTDANLYPPTTTTTQPSTHRHTFYPSPTSMRTHCFKERVESASGRDCICHGARFRGTPGSLNTVK